jgi:hypothetical protein
MFDNPTTQSLSQISGINLPFRIITSAVRVKVPFLILMIPFILSIGCAAGYRPVSKGVSLPYDAADLISRMLDQEDMVSSFYASGTVLIKGWAWQSEADLLIAGTRDPLKIKIEITHPWGKPVLHILIDNNRLEILSFDEKRIYIGELTAESLSNFFLPGEFCDHNLIWSVLRGYPHIAEYDRVVSSGMYRINLMNREGMDIEIIELYPENLLAKRVLFPQDSLDISFSGFKENDGINYAEEVTINDINGRKDLTIKTSKMVFNKPVPDQIFILEKPATFETVYMDDISDDADR